MNSLELALLSLCLGLVIGGGIAALIAFSYRARDKQRQHDSTELPDGLALVMEGMADAAAVIDTSNLVLATSKAASWLGIRTGATLDNHDMRALVREARVSRVAETQTMRISLGSGMGDSRLISARAIALGGRLALLTVRDISEAERVERMRHDFVANTSHELKTPVGAVTLLAEAIEMAADDADQVRHFASRLHAEALRLGNLTSRIMNLSRLQSTDSLSETRIVSIDEAVASALDSHLIQAESGGVEVVRGGDRGLFVRGDAQVLTDAIGNLVANAIAYSPEGSRVGIGVKQVDDTVEISVSDQGIGIDEADQTRIFERFYRADQARSRRTGGTGLGLSIVKHAVQRHGGSVRLWSRPGRGSTFTITLQLTTPLSSDDEPQRRSLRRRKLEAAGQSTRAGATSSKKSGKKSDKKTVKKQSAKNQAATVIDIAPEARRVPGDPLPVQKDDHE